MKIVCVGGGPAGLYVAILTKLADPGHHVVVLERRPPAATYGWGVVFWDDLLDDLYRSDPVSAARIWAECARWRDYAVQVGDGRPGHIGGGGVALRPPPAPGGPAPPPPP